MENGKSKGEVKAKTLEVLPTPNKSIGNAATVAAARDHGAEIRTALWELKEGTIAVLEMVHLATMKQLPSQELSMSILARR